LQGIQIHAREVSIVSIIGVVRPSAVPGDIFIPISAHADVTKAAMTLGLIAVPISGATNHAHVAGKY